MARPTVVITRPEAQATPWAQALQQAGWPVLRLPLLRIEPLVGPGTPPPWAGACTGWHAVMAVSPTAVEVVRAAGWPPPSAPVRLWAPGAGTARALRAWGVPPDRLDAPDGGTDVPTDSEVLWGLVRHQVRPGARVLVLRGASEGGRQGRDWLLQQVRAAGGVAQPLVVYRRTVPAWDACQRAEAERAADGGVWLFSSCEAVAALQRLLPQQRWEAAAALATHPRIAAAAQAAGFGRVLTVAAHEAALRQALESLA